jgi:hypothetical protein
MIKITQAHRTADHTIHLVFSDGTSADMDFSYLLEKGTVLTDALKDDRFFASFFLELGALCWPNGLEFSPQALHQRAEELGVLVRPENAA